MNEAHGEVDTGAHVVSCEAAHEGVEFSGRGTDAEEEGDLDENDEEGTCAGWDES